MKRNQKNQSARRVTPFCSSTLVHRVYSIVLYLFLTLALGGCGHIAVRVSTPMPLYESNGNLHTPDNDTPSMPTPSQPWDSGWITTEANVQIRRMRIIHENELVPVHIVRIDPSQVQFHVVYSPDHPTNLSTLCTETKALAAINGGFFDANNRATALVISEGIASGYSYEGQGGMFAIDSDGNLSLRCLSEQPYNPDEHLMEAFQSWPMLIKPGKRLAYMNPHDNDRARRSVIALDQNNRVLLLVFSSSTFTLSNLATWLISSDLTIDAALNLDGGSSTGLCLNTESEQELIAPFTPLPLVLVINP